MLILFCVLVIKIGIQIQFTMDRCLQLIRPFNKTGLVEKIVGPCWSCIDQPSLQHNVLTQEDKKFMTNVHLMTPVKINTHHRFRYHWGVFSPSLQEIVSSMLHLNPVEYWGQYQAIYVTIESFKINCDGSGYTGSAILYPMKKQDEQVTKPTLYIKPKSMVLKRKQELNTGEINKDNEFGGESFNIESSYIDRPEKRLRF